MHQDVRHELWATFSVEDHRRPGAFVAEVLLYDKLIIPVPPTEADGLSVAEVLTEQRRWAKWDPQRQREILDILGDRAEKIPWTAARQAEWRIEMARGFANARRDGYFLTGTVLQRFAPRMARAVNAVSQYHSLDELEHGAHIRRREPHEALPAGTLMAVLGYELLTPEVLDPRDLGVLADAVAVARESQYREARHALYEWQHRFVSDAGLTDAASIAAAVEEMESKVKELNHAVTSQRRWKSTKKFFTFLGLGASAAGLLPAVAPVAKGVGVVASVGAYVADSATGSLDPGLVAATLLVDARKRLDLEGPE